MCQYFYSVMGNMSRYGEKSVETRFKMPCRKTATLTCVCGIGVDSNYKPLL